MWERDLTEPEDEAGDDELSHDSEEEEEELRDFKTTLYTPEIVYKVTAYKVKSLIK